MASPIKKVAIFGAAGNFGTPITAALIAAGFAVTAITREESQSVFPDGIPVIRTTYTVERLTKALAGQDAAVCVVGPGGIGSQIAMIDAAEAAGVKRFIVDDFGWGPESRSLPEFDAIGAPRKAAWDHARAKAKANSAFSFTGVSIGNPIDWALKRFPAMGFDVTRHISIIYDDGTAMFTGTTLEGIGQAIVGVLSKPDETANLFVKARSLLTCQNDLLLAFQSATPGHEWEIQHARTKALIEQGRAKHASGQGGWILNLVVAQLFEPGEGRGILAATREESDADLLGIQEETPEEVVKKALA
ncbi:NmrA-like family protein [Podospora didyma]|uniref:NmrA-like family protein n=1 Tax=Podospora didyma TaxID=330526 RepID=A0AAE0NQM3_9PEZI|nr:NmrA-like family protein [Podospora didyma]